MLLHRKRRQCRHHLPIQVMLIRTIKFKTYNMRRLPRRMQQLNQSTRTLLIQTQTQRMPKPR
jgi:hypothetical protein